VLSALAFPPSRLKCGISKPKTRASVRYLSPNLGGRGSVPASLRMEKMLLMLAVTLRVTRRVRSPALPVAMRDFNTKDTRLCALFISKFGRAGLCTRLAANGKNALGSRSNTTCNKAGAEPRPPVKGSVASLSFLTPPLLQRAPSRHFGARSIVDVVGGSLCD
jgi:hypothetical protein